jgi:hypothetical protein
MVSPVVSAAGLTRVLDQPLVDDLRLEPELHHDLVGVRAAVVVGVLAQFSLRTRTSWLPLS